MKRYIRSAYNVPSIWGDYKKYDPNEWLQEDIELHQSIDWAARNYEEYPVEGETYRGTCHVYGLDGDIMVPAEFQLMLRSNPIYPPYYAPVDPYKVMSDACRKAGVDEDSVGIVGPMFDGTKRGMYDVHNRFETQELYDVLSD